MRTEVCDALLENAKRGRLSTKRKTSKERLLMVEDSREAEAEIRGWFLGQTAFEVSGNGHEEHGNGYHPVEIILFTKRLIDFLPVIPATQEDIAARKLEEQRRALERVQSGIVTPEMFRYAQKSVPSETVFSAR